MRMLEEENARLRGENRAMINSLLSVAGHPPVDFPAAAQSATKMKPKLSLPQMQAKTERESNERILQRARAMQANPKDAA